MANIIFDHFQPSHPFDAIAVDIETRYEGIVNVVRERKEILLTRLTEFREEYDSLLSSRDRTERELERTKEYIETIKENDLKMMQHEFLDKIEDKMQKLQISTANYFIRFECESEELEDKLSRLGELVKTDYKLPNYSEMVAPVVAVGKKGNGKDQLNMPRGVAFDEATQLIYICDLWNSVIKIVSLEGNFVSEFGHNVLDRPWGILVDKGSVFVSDCFQRTVYKFDLNTQHLMKRIGKEGSLKGEFNTPRSLAIGPDGDLYVAEYENNRLSVLDRHLNFKRFIRHQLISSPGNIQFTDDFMLILSFDTTDRVHLLTLHGEYLKSIILIDSESWTWFCCLDRANYIIVSHSTKHLVQIYNLEGDLLHTIGNTLFESPFGVTTTRSGKLIVVSEHKEHGLQIF